jgi:hypothetical protein
MITIKNFARAVLALCLCATLPVPRTAHAQVGGMNLSGTSSIWNTNLLRYTLDGSGSTNLLTFTNATSAYGDTNATHIKYVAASNKWLLATNGLAWIATNTYSYPTGTWKTLAAGTTFAHTRYQPRSVGTIASASPTAATTYNISADASGNVTTTAALASADEISTGTNDTKIVTPLRLANASLGALVQGLIFVDAVSGNDTTGTGSERKPYATLTKAQTMATSGNTIYGARGTFAESGLGKQGVAWYFNDGVFLSGANGYPPFFLGATNSTTLLTISGRLTHTNELIAVGYATNCTAVVDLKDGNVATSAGIVFDLVTGYSTSNTLYYTCDKLLDGCVYRNTTAYSNVVMDFFLEARQSMKVKPVSAGTLGFTNYYFSFKSPKFIAPNPTGAFFNTPCKVNVMSKRFTKTGAALTVIGTNYWFDVTIASTNDLNTNVAGVKGVFNIEN